MDILNDENVKTNLKNLKKSKFPQPVEKLYSMRPSDADAEYLTK